MFRLTKRVFYGRGLKEEQGPNWVAIPIWNEERIVKMLPSFGTGEGRAAGQGMRSKVNEGQAQEGRGNEDREGQVVTDTGTKKETELGHKEVKGQGGHEAFDRECGKQFNFFAIICGCRKIKQTLSTLKFLKIKRFF